MVISPISAMISSLDRRVDPWVGERMSAVPSCVAPISSSGRVLRERPDVNVPSVVE